MARTSPKRSPVRRFAPAAAAVVIAAVVVFFVVRGGDEPEKLELSAYLEQVAEGEVVTATIRSRDDTVTGELTDGSEYRTPFPGDYVDELTTTLVDAGIELEVDNAGDPFWQRMLYELLPVLILVGVFVYFLIGMQGGRSGLGFGKVKPRKPIGDAPSVTFEDVAGADEAVEELAEIKDFLADPDRFAAVGARIPKGVLLFGPPGTGKTLLARAVAGEAGAPFYSISGSDFVEMFVGVGASRVRDLFQQAKETAPAIIFVDEIDAVGRHRGAGLGGGHDEREQTLNQLLVEMDGFDATSGVILIAATNRPDILDPALLRPGRFDRQIVVDRPDLAGRRAILGVHAEGKQLGDDVDLDLMARRTPGFTGADLANLLNEAALLTARRGLEQIGRRELAEAVDRVMAGPERRSRVMSEKEKRVIAYHEAGHALVGHVLPNTDAIHKVSIIARGRALGWTLALPEEDRFMRTRAELRDEMAMLMGGRTAEELTFGDPTTGAMNDIERATEIARAMVTQFGMSEAIGPQQLGQRSGEPFLGRELGHEVNYSDQMAATIDAEVRRLVDQAHEEAREILTLHRATLDRLADELVARETLEEDQLMAILGHLDSWESTGSSVRTERSAPVGPEPAAPRGFEGNSGRGATGSGPSSGTDTAAGRPGSLGSVDRTSFPDHPPLPEQP